MENPQEYSFLSADGKTTVYYSLWLPKGDPVGVVQICHGMGEHIARYAWLAEQLTAQGYAVCGDDHLGHGRTARTKEDLGYFGEKDGWLHLVEDEHTLRGDMQRRFPGLRYFLLGHSMGSFITRNYVAKYGDGLAGYICCGTSGPNPGAGLGIFLTNILCALGKGRKTGYFINKLAFGGYNSRYENAQTGLEWLSRDQSVYLPFADDEKCNFIFTNAGFRDLFRLLNNVTGLKWSARIPKDLPILVMSGDMDPVGQYGEGPKKVYAWLREAGIRDVTLKLYPDARHELHNELNRDEVVEDLAAWLSAR